MRNKKVIVSFGMFVTFLFLILSSCNERQAEKYDTWEEYLGGPGRNHYSSLIQIDTSNVNKLKTAWVYSAPDSGQMQMTPIIVDGILYGVTAAVQAFALDAATGKEIWRFGDTLKAWHSTSRGVTYWSDGKDKRILFTMGPSLVALDAGTGKLIESFGEKGKVDLHTGLPATAKDKFIISNTPGTVFEDLIILPVRVAEDESAAPGDIRAFDIRTGKLAWSFHTIPYPGERGYDTWPKDAYKNEILGGANNWAGMAIDRKAGILFVPTGSAAPDFYGGLRKGANLYANCLLALDASTGKLIWHYQFVHHDIWDRDPPAPPNLIRVRLDGKLVDAVAQVTKQGYVFVFDRKTGSSLFPVQELKVPLSTLTGEEAWVTQPVPSMPKPFARQAYELTEHDISLYAENKEELRKIFLRSDKRLYGPPSLEGTFLLPGYDGGAEWGGAAADPEQGILYVNSNEMAWILKMDSVSGHADKWSTSGQRIYASYCSSCHAPDLSGNTQSGYPSLIGIAQKKDKDYVNNIVISGKGTMPGFPQLNDREKKSLLDFLYGNEKKEVMSDTKVSTGPSLPYKHAGYHKFLDNQGRPGISPPWGTLNAIDLNTGEYAWKITLGETPGLKGYPATGCENYGGPVVTASGLLFIAATKDGMFRAFDKRTGKLLWQTALPAPGFATPATYQVNGKQYIVIACGGEKLGTPKNNKVVAFALE